MPDILLYQEDFTSTTSGTLAGIFNNSTNLSEILRYYDFQ